MNKKFITFIAVFTSIVVLLPNLVSCINNLWDIPTDVNLFYTTYESRFECLRDKVDGIRDNYTADGEEWAYCYPLIDLGRLEGVGVGTFSMLISKIPMANTKTMDANRPDCSEGRVSSITDIYHVENSTMQFVLIQSYCSDLPKYS
ncbi:MAG: hypothetical protein PHX51_01675 [Clostridia bacterium]|nr:hypothetical protein [Clostridia bacterium]